MPNLSKSKSKSKNKIIFTSPSDNSKINNVITSNNEIECINFNTNKDINKVLEFD